MSRAGTYARVPMGEAFDVMCQELDDIVNRMCGIEEVALAYAWMQNWAGLGDGVAVGQAAGSGSAATNGEPERAASSPSLVGEPPPTDWVGGTGGSPTRHLAAVPTLSDLAARLEANGLGRFASLDDTAVPKEAT